MSTDYQAEGLPLTVVVTAVSGAMFAFGLVVRAPWYFLAPVGLVIAMTSGQ
jgi:hypothetical protein